MSQNAWKWIGTLAFAGMLSLGEIFTDSKFPGWWDLIRHVGAGMIIAAQALKTTLAQKA